jgi:DNA-binding MarR family transcriptional regulator
VADSARILDSIRRLVRLLRLTDRAAQSELGISGAQLFVLHELAKTPEMSLSELAQKTRTDQSSVSVVVSRLVEAGFVMRERDGRDARRLVLTLTKNGRALAEKSPPAVQEKMIEILERMQPADRHRFAEIFSQIIEELGAANGVAPMMFDDVEPPRGKTSGIMALLTNMAFYGRFSTHFVTRAFHHPGWLMLLTSAIGGVIVGLTALYGPRAALEAGGKTFPKK